MFKIGDIIVHKTLGKGEVIYVEDIDDSQGITHHYFDVHFENDKKYDTHKFSEDSIKPFLVEHIPTTEVED